MGIKDDQKIIEQWLASIAPKAFFYKLPKGVSLALIIQDLSALLVSAFLTTRSKTGFDFVQNLASPIVNFSKSAIVDPEVTKIDWRDGSLESKLHGATVPTIETMEEWRKTDWDQFEAGVRDNARFVLTRDNPMHMPANRDLLHEERYRVTDNIRDQPFSEEELRQGGMHICMHRKMPGMLTDTEPHGDINLLRQRANRTPLLRQAYQNYGPWALARQIREECERIASMDKMKEHTRAVLIDSVIEDFPENYENAELWDLPADWHRKPSKTHIYNLDGSDSTRAGCLQIGEADRKIIWYIQNCSNVGDQVLVRSMDSDILFILLVNMHLFRDKSKPKAPWTRTIFLDMNAPNMKKERYERRFVCINLLIEALESKNPDNIMAGIANPAHVLTAVALMCGSDYTQNPYGLGAGKIFDVFQTVCKNKSVYDDLSHLIRLGDAEINDDAAHVETASFPEHVEHLSLAIMHMESYDCFLRRLYQSRLTKVIIKKLSINTAVLLTWPKLEFYLKEMDKDKKDPTSYAIPNEMERLGDARRLMWVLHYWMNSHHDFGDFPAPDIDHPTLGGSIWGWVKCRKLLTKDDGQDRFINKTKIEYTNKQFIEFEASRSVQHDEHSKSNPFVCSKDNNIVPFNNIWHCVAAEMIARSRHSVKRIITPLWKK